MQKLVWQNANGVELDLTSGNYGITEWEGFSNTSLNIQQQQVPFQDGGVFLDALIEQRELSVTLAIQDNNNLELRYQQRRALISALNPKLGEGYLIYTNDFISKRIKCVPQIPLFETHNSDTVGTPKASLSWTCCSPYWEDLEETVVDLTRGSNVIINNDGDVSAMPQMSIEGTMTNPVIVNQDTDKAIKLEMTTDKTVNISTEVGKKGIYTLKADYKIIDGLLYNDSIEVNNQTILVGVDICIINEFGVTTHYNSPIANTLLCINYADGVYIAGAEGQGIIRSTNGIEWEIVSTSYSSGAIEKISYQNGIWFACGRTSSLPALIGKSTDKGLTWTFTGLYEFYQNAGFVIYYNNSYYVKNTSYLRVTTDFENWTSIQPANIPDDVIEIGTNHWLGVTTGGKIVESTNPQTWTVIATPTQNSLNKIKKINGKYFGLGYMTIVESDNVSSWSDITPESTLTDFSFLTLTFVINQYSFYANKGLFVTSDLSEWDIQKYKLGVYKDIVFAFGYYYIFYNLAGASECEVLRSVDGLNFETVDFPFSNISIIGTLLVGNTLVIYSNNKIIVTTDGVNFTEKNTGLSSVQKVQFANGLYFVNTYTTQYTTFKGEDLEALTDMGMIIDNIIFYNGVYYRTTRAGSSETSNGFTIYSSTDLQNWETLQVITTGWCVGLTIVQDKLLVIKNYDIGALISTTFTLYDILDFTQTKNYYIMKGGVRKFYIKNGYIWVCGDNGLIGKSSNGYVWSIQYTCGYYKSLCIENKNLFVGNEKNVVLLVEVTQAGVIDYNNNLVSKMTANSNLDWNIKQGENNIFFTSDSGEGSLIITYRQKYIGV